MTKTAKKAAKGSSLTAHIVHAFTSAETPSIGNPAAIVRVKRFPPARVMEQAATRLKMPMTSFVRMEKDALTFSIRHFSPDGQENHVCGHATLAAAEQITRDMPDRRDGIDLTFRLNPKYKINPKNEFNAVARGDEIDLTLPAITEMEEVTDPVFYRRLTAALGVADDDITRPVYYAPRILNYVVALRDPEKLLAMKPDFARLKSLAKSKKFPHEGIMATAKSNIAGFDILTRVFLPVIGVDEDVACGSANCSVVPYWATKRPDVFMPGKMCFRGLFPYPPGREYGVYGGVQDLKFDPEAGTVTIRSRATHYGTVSVAVGKGIWRNAPKP